jgi:hypothetical protein
VVVVEMEEVGMEEVDMVVVEMEVEEVGVVVGVGERKEMHWTNLFKNIKIDKNVCMLHNSMELNKQ